MNYCYFYIEKIKIMKLSESEKRDLINSIQSGNYLPDKYRFLLFENSDQVELKWNGKTSEITNVVLPFQIIEHVDEPRIEESEFLQNSFIDFETGRQLKGWTNKLIWGDNKFILSSLKNGPFRDEIEKQGGIKLIYIDPPFDVGADFSMNVEVGETKYEKNPNVLEHIAYRDTWGLGADSFLSMIYERLILMKDLLAEDGSIYVHCDWRLSGHLRVLMDEIFGKENHINQIQWCFNVGGKGTARFARKHNTILFYSKSKNYFFDGYASGMKRNTGDKSFGGKIGIDENGRRYQDKLAKSSGKYYRYYLDEAKIPEDWWTDINSIQSGSSERLDYPTQKPEALLERIIKSSSKENDIICDFFNGSGTTAAVAEKLHRKWICTDLGKFSIHTTRKRIIDVQRELKKSKKDWRAFEILNLGKYQRQYFIYDGKNDRDELKIIEKQKKEKEFENLILEAYQSVGIDGFKTIHGKKGINFVSIGPINQPLSRNHVEEVILECIKNKIITVDILGFEYEMGLFPTIQEEAKEKGLRLTYKQIPMEIFDKRAVAKNEVLFHDVAYIDFKAHQNEDKVSVELTDFAVFYSEDNLNISDQLQRGKSKIVVESGNIVEKFKDKDGNITENLITKSWKDWIDYWSVDFNYESKKEIISLKENGIRKEIWTGNYVFENEWQAFRTGKKGEKIEFRSAEKQIKSPITTIAVKVIDIFGNDTMKLLKVNL